MRDKLRSPRDAPLGIAVQATLTLRQAPRSIGLLTRTHDQLCDAITCRYAVAKNQTISDAKMPAKPLTERALFLVAGSATSVISGRFPPESRGWLFRQLPEAKAQHTSSASASPEKPSPLLDLRPSGSRAGPGAPEPPSSYRARLRDRNPRFASWLLPVR